MNSSSLSSEYRPRGVSLKQAAAHAGVEPRTYRRLENEGILPRPIYRETYDLYAVDAALDGLSGLGRAAASDSREQQLDRWLRSGGGNGS